VSPSRVSEPATTGNTPYEVCTPEDRAHVLIGLSYGRLAGPRSGVPSACVTSDSLLPNSKPLLAQGHAGNDRRANIHAAKYLARGVMRRYAFLNG